MIRTEINKSRQLFCSNWKRYTMHNQIRMITEIRGVATTVLKLCILDHILQKISL